MSMQPSRCSAAPIRKGTAIPASAMWARERCRLRGRRQSLGVPKRCRDAHLRDADIPDFRVKVGALREFLAAYLGESNSQARFVYKGKVYI